MNQNKVFIPLSIILAGLIIAGAVFFAQKDEVTSPTIVSSDEEGEELSIKPVSSDDHILGNPDAEVLIVEYSDFECPFCSRFHETMDAVMNEYGSSGKVAWVYRHFPLDQAHPNARSSAEASECVNALAGPEAFWNFSKQVFANQPDSVEPENVKTIALSLGVNEEECDTCVTDRTYADQVENDYQDGLLIAQTDPNFGTPYSIVMSKSGAQASIVGAQPYSLIKQVIDTLLAE